MGQRVLADADHFCRLKIEYLADRVGVGGDIHAQRRAEKLDGIVLCLRLEQLQVFLAIVRVVLPRLERRGEHRFSRFVGQGLGQQFEIFADGFAVGAHFIGDAFALVAVGDLRQQEGVCPVAHDVETDRRRRRHLWIHVFSEQRGIPADAVALEKNDDRHADNQCNHQAEAPGEQARDFRSF